VLSFALDVADRVLVLENGRLVHDEPRDTVDEAKVAVVRLRLISSRNPPERAQ
jgi:ABC-type branched-subunit amino acid transport system ATPase component